ncbi:MULTISPECIES: 3'-5' exonuclease [Chitinophagaceae]
MDHFLLVIDTESSDIPQMWNAPSDQSDCWPYVVQVAWLVYDWNGKVIKQESHYIRNDDYIVTDASRAIHHITDAVLQEKGEGRKVVLELLQNDLIQYRPIVVGHFVELDYKLLNAEFCRIGQKKNPLMSAPLFCTMLTSTSLPYMEINRRMKLTELYHYLFSEGQPYPHHALYDALATARCFFKERELLSIDWNEAREQNPVVRDHQYERNTRKIGIIVVAAVILLLIILIYSSFR